MLIVFQAAAKAVDPNDPGTMSLFSKAPAYGGGDASHGGALHKEQRTDRTGRVQTRWIATPRGEPATHRPGSRMASDHATIDLEDMIQMSARHATRRKRSDKMAPMKPLGEQVGMFTEAQRQGFDHRNYFPSGNNHAGEIRGFADAGWNVGVALSDMNEATIHEVLRLKGRQTKVFVDSGAFSEVNKKGELVNPISDKDWDKKFDAYDRLGVALGEQMFAVTPDRVGDQSHTLRLLNRFGFRIRALRRAGVNFIVPIMKGTMSMAQFDIACGSSLGFDDYIRGIPLVKNATTPTDLHYFLSNAKPAKIHLLGMGPNNPQAEKYAQAIHSASPHTKVQMDSGKRRGALGRKRRGPLPLTAALDEVHAEATTALFDEDNDGDGSHRDDLEESYHVPLWSDQRAYPQDYTSKTERKRIARAVGLSKAETTRFISSPGAFLASPVDPDLDERSITMDQIVASDADNPLFWDQHPLMESQLRTAWTGWYHKHGTVYLRKAESIRRLWGLDEAEAMKSQMNLFGGDPSHGGKLHKKTIIDKHGTSASRWVSKEQPAPPRTKTHFETMGHMGAPTVGEKGFRELSPEREAAELRARACLAHATALLDDDYAPHVIQAMDNAFAGIDDDWDEVVAAGELGTLLGEPGLTDLEAAEVLELATASWRRGGNIPDAVAESILADHWAPSGRLRLENVSKADAVDFIREHHSQMAEPNLRGLIFAVGCKSGGRTVAVATATTPSGPWANRVKQSNVLELSRIASDGTVKNASSMLCARMIDLAPRAVRGGPGEPWLFVTYSLLHEKGTTYKALKDKGLRPVGITPGKKPSGARAGGKLGYGTPPKIIWEAGPVALPPKWDLLKGQHQGDLFAIKGEDE